MNKFDFLSAMGHIDREIVERTMDSVYAGSVYSIEKETAMKNISNGKGRRIGKIAVIAAAACLILSAAAYAIGAHTGFFQSAFGTGVKGRDSITVTDGNGPGTSYTYPAVERVDVDQEAAETLLGGYVSRSGRVAEVCGYTFTVDSFVFDENGIGVMTVDVDNPDGLGIKERYDYNKGEYAPITISLRTAGGDILDSREYLDEDSTSNTHARYVIYVTPFSDGQSGRDVEIVFRAANGTFHEEFGHTFANYDETQLIIPVSEAAPSEKWQGGEMTGFLSPVGFTLKSGGTSLDGCSSLTLKFKDGTEYIVSSEEYANSPVGSLSSDYTSMYMAFNRLVEPENVETIIVEGLELKKAE